MKNKFLRSLFLGVMFSGLFLGSVFAADPCSETTKKSGGTTVTSNGIKDVGNGYNLELWRDGNSGSMTVFGGDADCAFKANWNNSGDFLARVGYYYGGGNAKTHSDIGDIHAEYNYTKTGNGGGYSYIGVYGWTNSPQIEYYIVDDSYNGMGTPYGTQKKGSYTVDGATYTLYTGTRTNAPSITGNSTFTQVFAVRSSARQCGHISVSEHFKKWEQNGIKLGGLYDCKILCEAGGGTGSIEYTYATMYIGEPEPEAPAVPQSPFKGVIAIPGTVEAENYDLGGNRFAYSDTDNENEGGAYRQDGVDIVEVSGGYAVGYTTSSEWLEYSVKIEKAGKYDVVASASNGNNDILINLFIDDAKVGSVSANSTGDWDVYTNAKGSVTLPAGEHILKVAFGTDYINLDNIKFFLEGSSPESDPDEEGGQSTPETPSAIGASTFFSEDGAYFGPTCASAAEANYKGAYYTGEYPSPFKTYLGKTDAEIQAKLDQLWSHYFKGNDNSKVYYDKGSEAYIYDTGNADVRSEGMSYGMMICVQTNHKEEFDKLWSFARNHMWHNSGQWDGYFAWQVKTDGSKIDSNCAPDGEMYFMMSLLFAAHRWGNDGKFNYMADAQTILKKMIKGNNGSLFNEQHKVITFQPYNCADFSDPSYDLPAFVDLFARWSTSNNNFWTQAASATRNHLKNSSHSTSGLFSDYNNFDGSPKTTNFNSNSHKYMYDAMRCAMNVGMDYYLFGADAKNQEEMMLRLINHFEKDGYQHARFNWDGSGASESYTLGERGANAVGCFALMGNPANDSKVKKNLELAWSGQLMTGQYRYYDGLVHYLSMLHLCGNFKIWKPMPEVEEKTVFGNGSVTYNGVTYTESTVVDAFEDCKVYKVTIDVKEDVDDDPTSVYASESEDGILVAPNPAKDQFVIKSQKVVQSVEMFNMSGQSIMQNNGEKTVNFSAVPGVYILKVTTGDGNVYTERVNVK